MFAEFARHNISVSPQHQRRLDAIEALLKIISKYFTFPLAPRAGGVHPLVSYRLYSAICVPIFLYGSELRDISSRQFLLLERAHRKILRTLMGLPVRCRVSALLGLMGARSFASLISQRQLSFIHSFSLMSTDTLPRCVLALRRLANHGSGSVLHTWSQLLRRHSLPDIDEILASSISVYGWRRYVRSHLQWLRATQLCQPSVLTFHLAFH